MSNIMETLIGKLKFEEHPRRTYLIPIVSVIISYFVFYWLNLFHTDPGSARYMLSALVQSEAAIVAIVISLSFIAIKLQLSVSSYSPKVVEIFKNNPHFQILMVSYILTIIYNLCVLKILGESVKPCFEIFISLSYFLGIYCFLALIPYTYNMFIMLRPFTIIEKLSHDITKENLLMEDPIQPIIDIVRGSMMKYDYETTRNGLEAIGNRIYDMFEKENFSEDEDKKVSDKIYRHFIRVGNLVVNREDEYSTIEVIRNIEKIGNKAFKEELKWVPVKVRVVLEIIQGSSRKRGLMGKLLDDAFIQALRHLEGIKIKYPKEFKKFVREIGLEVSNKL